MFNPLYVLQNRAQLDPQAKVSTLARVAVAEHGFFGGLWAPGLIAICLRGGFGGIRVGLYPQVKEALPGNGFGTKLLAGGITGSIGCVLFNPAEVVRVRMSGPKPYSSTPSAFLAIAQEEGLVNGLWRGTGVAVTRAAIYSGTQLAFYETAKRTLIRYQILGDDGPPTHLTASFVAGVVAQMACQPVDTLKAVLQNKRGSPSTAIAALRDLIRTGGTLRLYRGLLPAVACKGPVVMLFLPLVEQFRRCLGLEYL